MIKNIVYFLLNKYTHHICSFTFTSDTLLFLSMFGYFCFYKEHAPIHQNVIYSSPALRLPPFSEQNTHKPHVSEGNLFVLPELDNAQLLQQYSSTGTAMAGHRWSFITSIGRTVTWQSEDAGCRRRSLVVGLKRSIPKWQIVCQMFCLFQWPHVKADLLMLCTHFAE